MFVKIMLAVAVICLFGLMCYVFYVFGMIKGYKNLIKDDRGNWGKLDAALYETLTGENKKEFERTVTERVGELKLQQFKDRLKIKKRKKLTKKSSKENKK
tara:strand:- start:353 stop:652 length:300 start_codon:yes stop_codon:yes gene_type:complete